MSRLLLVSQDVFPAETPSWWRLYFDLFREVYGEGKGLILDVVDLLPRQHAFYVDRKGVPLDKGDISSSEDNEVYETLFQPGVKPSKPITIDGESAAQLSVRGTYFPAESIEEAMQVIQCSGGPIGDSGERSDGKRGLSKSKGCEYDWLIFPGSRFSIDSVEGCTLTKLLERILDPTANILDHNGTKLLGICYGFELLAELLIGAGTLKPNPEGHNIQFGMREGRCAKMAESMASESENLRSPSAPSMFYCHWDYLPCEDLENPRLNIQSRFHESAGTELWITHANPHLGKIHNQGIPPSWRVIQTATDPSKPPFHIAVAFMSDKMTIFGLQGHPEFTADAFHQLMGRVAHRDDFGFNGINRLPGPVEPEPVDRNCGNVNVQQRQLMYSFPVMPMQSSSEMGSVARILGGRSRAEGVTDWLRIFLGVEKSRARQIRRKLNTELQSECD